MTEKDYLDLIPSANRQQPDFVDVIKVNVAVPLRVQDLLTSMIPLFDVDVAVGDQLDIIGKWVGVSRNVDIPISGVYFSWDGSDPTVGWDYGTWQPSSAPTAVTVLPDDSYRFLIKARIAANHWDGTTPGAYAIWDEIFTTIKVLIQDNCDMTYELGFYGGIVDSLTLALVLQGYIPLKPEGVRLAGVFTPVDTGPLFSWDLDTTFFQGWDSGSWVNEYEP